MQLDMAGELTQSTMKTFEVNVYVDFTLKYAVLSNGI